MLPGNKFRFVILVWDSNGSWDYIWNATSSSPPAAPQTISTKERFVDVRLTKLYYLDDSDDLSNGEGSFTLVVQEQLPPALPKKSTLSVATFATGTDLNIVPPKRITIGPEVVTDDTRNVSVQVKGLDDDSGSFPQDSDDLAETVMTPLDLPIGEGKEEVIDRKLSLWGNPTTDGEELRFVADLLYSVTYV
jgi:hypothetical protein